MEYTLVITRQTNGEITIEGPIMDKTLCYGMLEVAKDAIREFNAKPNNAGLVITHTPLSHNGT